MPNQTERGSLHCININILDDEELENTEQFTLQLASLSPRSVQINSNSSNTTVNILDNDSMSLFKSHSFMNNNVLINTYFMDFSTDTKI